MQESELERLSTGLSALDAILGGGVPVGSFVILAGAPGAGKTVLAQQICFHNGTSEHKAVYYSTVSESPSKLTHHLKTFEFFDSSALVDRVEFINLGEMLQDQEGDGLRSITDEIVRKCVAERPVLVTIDSAEALRDAGFGNGRLRDAVHELASKIAQVGTTLLLLGEFGSLESGSGPEPALADGILEIVYESREPADARWIRVLKMRSSHHLPGRHTLRITGAGVEVFVRAETVDSRVDWVDAPEERIKTGVPGLDEMLGGGLPVGDATIVLGPSGCGKTALGLGFVQQGLSDGQRCLYVSFQENSNQLLAKAARFGWDLSGALESGQLKLYHVPETALDLDVIAAVIREEIDASPLHRVVIDSLAEMVASAQESSRFPAYTRALLSSLRAAGVSVLTTSETNTLGPSAEPLGGLSFLYHNVILLRYFETESEVGRAAAVLKMRDSDHAKGIREFSIMDRGFVMGKELKGVSGLLGWSALRGDGHLPSE